MNIFFLILSLIFFNLILYLKIDSISNFFVLFDKPDRKLKRHLKQASLVGGSIILVNIYLIIFLLKLMDINNLIFEDNFVYASILLITLFYFVGLIDDLKNLTPNLKLLFLILSIVLVIYLFPEIKLEQIKISFLQKIYYFNEYSTVFIILSFLLLANAMNMFDGINLQLILFSIFVLSLFIFKGFIPIFFVLLSIPLIFISILNFKGKVFLGDNGAFLLSALLGCAFIYQYKNFENFFYGDEIFIILLIPSIDMLRLFFLRLKNKGNPFKGDLNHLHHIVYNYTNDKNKTIFITLILCVLPSLFLILNIYTPIILLINLTIYISLIFYLINKNKSMR